VNEIYALINILGAVALLLWGLRMVSTGVSRKFGAELRHGIAISADNRVKSLLAGMLVTIALQSSTATCLMSASFTGRGLMSTATALAIMLGADIGTSLVAKLLTFNVGPLSALLVLVGFVMFRAAEGRLRHLARILVGLGLMLLSLRLLNVASDPLRNSAQMRLILHDLDGAWLVGMVLAAGVAMLAHSSIATILLILPLASAGDFSLQFGLALILGANLGSALPPVLETSKDKPVVRRPPMGNALMRLTGCLMVLPLLGYAADLLPRIEADRAAQLIDAHIIFNCLLAVAFLPLVGQVARLVERLRPDEPTADDPGQVRYLDEAALTSPAMAIGAATRETLRIGDVVEDMLRRSLEMMETDNHKLASDIGKMDNAVDSLHAAVKLYLARLANEDLSEDERRRAREIMTFAINLEHAGDVIDRNLKGLAAKKIKRQLQFSAEGFSDIAAMFLQTQENLKVAMAIFVSGDVGLARRLVAEKIEIRNLERRSIESHLGRLQDGRRESIETSTLHLDILRDLKRVNAHIVSVAYSILEERGELEDSRLRQATDA
jgi:phosphate:Na+ symporter